ncbi:MAG: zinc-finger domain-containing protein, partial [Woeseiaceae bacterium]
IESDTVCQIRYRLSQMGIGSGCYNRLQNNASVVISVRARAGTVDQNLIQANSQRRYEVRRDDIPLSCPMPGMYLWNSHPKVYLPIEETGEAKCPYCGAEYILADSAD